MKEGQRPRSRVAVQCSRASRMSGERRGSPRARFFNLKMDFTCRSTSRAKVCMVVWADVPKERSEKGWWGLRRSAPESWNQAAIPPGWARTNPGRPEVSRPLCAAAVGHVANTNEPSRRRMRLFVPADGRTGGRADKRTDGRTDGPVCPAPPGCGGPRPGEAAPPPASSHQQGALFPGAPPGAAARPPRRRPGVPYRKRKRPAPASGGRAVVGSPLLSLRVAARAMAATALPPLPPQFKSIQHHLRTAQELDKREPVVAYYCEWGGRGTAPPGPEPGPGPSRPAPPPLPATGAATAPGHQSLHRAERAPRSVRLACRVAPSARRMDGEVGAGGSPTSWGGPGCSRSSLPAASAASPDPSFTCSIFAELRPSAVVGRMPAP